MTPGAWGWGRGLSGCICLRVEIAMDWFTAEGVPFPINCPQSEAKGWGNYLDNLRKEFCFVFFFHLESNDSSNHWFRALPCAGLRGQPPGNTLGGVCEKAPLLSWRSVVHKVIEATGSEGRPQGTVTVQG